MEGTKEHETAPDSKVAAMIEGSADDNVGHAAGKVFHTPELLEAIVLYLPMKTVLVVQRVSKTWRSTISSSPNLQTALGFRATKELGWEEKRFRVKFNKAVTAEEVWRSLQRPKKARFNPLLGELCTPMRQSPHYTSASRKERYALYSESLEQLSLDDKNESLQRAFAVLPPVCEVKITVSEFDVYYGIMRPIRYAAEESDEEERDEDEQVLSTHTDYVINESGVKISDIVEHLQNGPITPLEGFVYFKLSVLPLDED